MTLEEKFEQVESPVAIQLEKIADDYAIEFINWLSFNDLFYSIQFGNNSTEELLEIFKKERGW